MLAKKELKTEGIDTGKIISQVGFKKWKVHAKSPFGNVTNVVAYLGRYTHKIAITVHRIISIGQSTITFKYKDYADGDTTKEMTLSHAEFLRRFEQHILPKRFVKIRHYGLLQNHGKIQRLSSIRHQLKLSPPAAKVQVPMAIRMLEQYGKDITLCPKCGKGKLELIAVDYGSPRRAAMVQPAPPASGQQNREGPS